MQLKGGARVVYILPVLSGTISIANAEPFITTFDNLERYTKKNAASLATIGESLETLVNFFDEKYPPGFPFLNTHNVGPTLDTSLQSLIAGVAQSITSLIEDDLEEFPEENPQELEIITSRNYMAPDMDMLERVMKWAEKIPKAYIYESPRVWSGISTSWVEFNIFAAIQALVAKAKTLKLGDKNSRKIVGWVFGLRVSLKGIDKFQGEGSAPGRITSAVQQLQSEFRTISVSGKNARRLAEDRFLREGKGGEARRALYTSWSATFEEVYNYIEAYLEILTACGEIVTTTPDALQTWIDRNLRSLADLDSDIFSFLNNINFDYTIGFDGMVHNGVLREDGELKNLHIHLLEGIQAGEQELEDAGGKQYGQLGSQGGHVLSGASKSDEELLSEAQLWASELPTLSIQVNPGVWDGVTKPAEEINLWVTLDKLATTLEAYFVQNFINLDLSKVNTEADLEDPSTAEGLGNAFLKVLNGGEGPRTPTPTDLRITASWLFSAEVADPVEGTIVIDTDGPEKIADALAVIQRVLERTEDNGDAIFNEAAKRFTKDSPTRPQVWNSFASTWAAIHKFLYKYLNTIEYIVEGIEALQPWNEP
ncbi:hypothetical protein ABW19_dt0200314 [Dactylella cylindrospora]|nr:hypothetical protein ABW19_dt0200314 [Dactylella cylindrospora]